MPDRTSGSAAEVRLRLSSSLASARCWGVRGSSAQHDIVVQALSSDYRGPQPVLLTYRAPFRQSAFLRTLYPKALKCEACCSDGPSLSW